MILREVIVEVLSQTDLGVTHLIEVIDDMADYELLLEIEKLWTRMTAVKTSANILADSLGIEQGKQHAIVVMTGDERILEAISLKYPENLIAHANNPDQFYELMSYFNLWGCLRRVVIQQVKGMNTLHFAHYAARIGNYFKERKDICFCVLAPERLHGNFNSYFVGQDRVFDKVDDLP